MGLRGFELMLLCNMWQEVVYGVIMGRQRAVREQVACLSFSRLFSLCSVRQSVAREFRGFGCG
eukprot:scaffold17620_cov155-Isochrysis_galbana.AAC.1